MSGATKPAWRLAWRSALGKSLRLGSLSDPRLRLALHRYPMIFLVTGAATGILARAHLPSPDWVSWPICIGLVAFCAYCMLLRKVAWAWICAAILFVPLFAARQIAVGARYDSASILAFAGEESAPAIIEARVDNPVTLRRHPLADLPGRRSTYEWQSHIEVTVSRAKSGRQFREATGRLLVVVNGDLTARRPGDEVKLFGSLRRFMGPTNPGERDLRDVYRRRGLQARIDIDRPEQVQLVRKTRLPFARSVAWCGNYGREKLLQHTSESTGPLAIALVVGQRDFVDPQMRDKLLVTGTAHLLSVSGMHLAIIVLLAKLISMLARWPEKVEIVWIFAVCVSYVAITGGRPPVMRAALLVGGFMVAILLRRPSQPMNTLGFAGLVLLAWNPYNVMAVGVQLSFLAVATLLFCGSRSRSESAVVERAKEQEDRLQRLSENARSWPVRFARMAGNYLWQLTWFSICVTAISMPLVWYHFHVVSPISVFTNVVLSPLLIFALGSGVVTVGFGSVPVLGAFFGAVCSFFLELMKQVIEFSASVPCGHFWLPSPPGAWVVAFYLVLAMTLFWSNAKRATRLRRCWIPAWFVVAWLMATWPAPIDDGSIEATFVDVGHGTAVVLRFSEDDVWLYDCGRLANDSGSSRGIDSTLWALGVTRLNGVFLSHADSDHYNALPGVLKRFQVEQIVTPPGLLEQDEGGALEPIREAIRHAGVVVHEASAGQSIAAGGHEMAVLHPPSTRVAGNDNANSLVVRIQSGGRTFLLPGDLEPPGTDLLINQARPTAGGVLMAPHHGSLSMNAEAVLQWARPSETVVSGGRRATRPEVSEMLAVTGSGVHVTSLVGAVRVTIDKEGEVEIRSWKESPW